MAIIQDRRSVEAKMGMWVEIEVWRQRRAELIREAQERALAREARKVREAFAAVEERPAGVPLGMKVRWGLAEDEPAVADLLELNGMPRWVAFEERFIVAQKNGKLVGAVRYATESKRLTLGLLVVDPWAGERRVSKALYAGSRELARELGTNVVVASEARANYPRAAGFRHHGRTWHARVPRSDGGSSSGGRWGRLFGLWGTMAVPFYRAFR
jgi:acetyltransferase (GNAT) family protein